MFKEESKFSIYVGRARSNANKIGIAIGALTLVVSTSLDLTI